MRSAKPIRPQVALLVLPLAEVLGITNAHFVKRMFKRESKHCNVSTAQSGIIFPVNPFLKKNTTSSRKEGNSYTGSAKHATPRLWMF